MTQNTTEINSLISELNSVFNSHDFLKKFAKKFENNYINLLNEHNGNEAFRTVHSQIARYLSDNSETFQINKTKRVKSENIFGEKDEIQEWKKV